MSIQPPLSGGWVRRLVGGSVDSSTPTLTRNPASPPGQQPGISTAGIHLTAIPRPDGSFEVSERVWLRRPIRRLLLTPPADRRDRLAQPVAEQVLLRAVRQERRPR